MQELPRSPEDVLIQCSAAFGQGTAIGEGRPMSFTDEAGAFAAEFFRKNLTSVETWPESRDLAMDFSQQLGAQAVGAARDRGASVIEPQDIEQAIERLVPRLRCPLSP